MLSNISISEDDKQDQHEFDIDIAPQYDIDPDPTPIPNHKPKWDEKLIKEARNVVADLDDRRKARYQYKKEYVALSHTASLPTERCNKIIGRCYLMITNDPQFGPLKNKMDHSIPPL